MKTTSRCSAEDVIQERFLAPRVLHFGSEYAFWECNTAIASEIYPAGMPNNFDDNPKIRDFRFQYLADPTRSQYNMWKRAVAAYAECLLTKESDKLVAISGVAKDLGCLGGLGNYVAGLWKDHFIFDLLWHCGISSVGTRPLKYRAPTWSWASLNGSVQFRRLVPLPPTPSGESSGN
jgi:hypothetical protein